MKTILVTGASGYLGSSFTNKYKDEYSFEKYSLFNQKLEDINFDGMDIILHCAALVHQKIEHTYKKYYDINVEYPMKLANLAKKNGVKQFVFISTIAVYGEGLEKLDENTFCNPITAYGKSKLEAEKELLKLNDDTFVVSIVRSPMIYGKSAPGNIDSLINFLRKTPIIPLGGIKNKRSFIYIENLCHIISEVIVRKELGIFLASDDTAISTSKLIELIAKNLNKKIYLFKIPFFETVLKLGKPSFHKRLYGNLELDNSLTIKKLNLKNPYTTEEGILLMIKGEKI